MNMESLYVLSFRSMTTRRRVSTEGSRLQRLSQGDAVRGFPS